VAAAIFALVGTLIGVLGTLLVQLTQARTEDQRARRDAVRIACADFIAAVALMKTSPLSRRASPATPSS
jgi:hypothetical protein